MHGANKEWKFNDFFKMSAAEQDRMKLELAKHLGVQWACVNKDKPFALMVDGIDPYDPGKVNNARTLCMAAGGMEKGTMSTVLNICQVDDATHEK